MSEVIGQFDLRVIWGGAGIEFETSERGIVELVSTLRAHSFGKYRVQEARNSQISFVEIAPHTGRLLLKIENHTVIILANDAAFQLFAENLEGLKLQWARGGGEHLHVDPISNPYLVASNSEDLIISRKV